MDFLVDFFLIQLIESFTDIFTTLQLSEVANSLSPQGQLPLGIALMSRSSSIAQTLVQNGKANVNAYNGDVSQLIKLTVNFRHVKWHDVCRVAPYLSML